MYTLKIIFNKLLQYKHLVMVGFASLLGSFFNYLLQFLLGRSLSIEDFGKITSIFSLWTVLVVPAALFGTPIVREISFRNAGELRTTLKNFFWFIFLLTNILGFVLFLGTVFFQGEILKSLKLNDFQIPLMLGILVWLSYIVTPCISFMQGLQNFGGYSLMSVLSGLLRLIFSMSFVYLGYGVLGILFGHIGYASILVLLGFFLIFKLVGFGPSQNNELKTEHLFKFFREAVPAVVLSLALTSFINVDIVLARKFLTPLESGYYSGIITLGKILLFGAAIVVTVMIPQISAIYASKQNVKRAFYKFFSIQLFILSIGSLFYLIAPRIISNVFFGSKFDQSVAYLPLYTIFIFSFVLLNFLALFLISIYRHIGVFFVALGAASQFLLLQVYNESLKQFIVVNIVSVLIALIPISLYTFKVIKNELVN